MPAPLLWLGAAALGAYSANKANTAYLKRKSILDAMPGESPYYTRPSTGSIVTCGIYGVLDHTGIWIDGNIYELAGSGLIRCLSPERFIGNRSGNTIYVACNQNNQALRDRAAAQKAQSLLYTVTDYHVLKQNCHKFVAQMLTQDNVDITSFSDLNTFLHGFFAQSIRWNHAKIDFR